MKVAVFFTWDYSLKTWNESGTLARELKFFSEIKKQKNVSFSIFTYGGEEDCKLGIEHGLSDVHPFYLKKYYNNKILRILASFILPLRVSRKVKNVDIIFQNQLLGCWIPILIKKIYKKPLIIRTGYDMLEFAILDKKPRFIIFLYRLLTHAAVIFCDYFTVSSKSDLERFQQNFPKYENKFLLRQNWVEVGKLNPLSNRNKNKIITVGRLVNQKNFNFLVSEFKDTKETLEIDIVGSGPNEEELLNLAKIKNVKLNLLGNYKHEDLLELLKQYTFFVTTSVFEGNPKSLLEAMAAGCVVIASNINNHKEIITDNQNAFLYELSSGQLFEKFQQVKNSVEFLTEVSNNSYQHIKKEYPIKKTAELFYSDFERVLIK